MIHWFEETISKWLRMPSLSLIDSHTWWKTGDAPSLSKEESNFRVTDWLLPERVTEEVRSTMVDVSHFLSQVNGLAKEKLVTKRSHIHSPFRRSWSFVVVATHIFWSSGLPERLNVKSERHCERMNLSCVKRRGPLLPWPTFAIVSIATVQPSVQGASFFVTLTLAALLPLALRATDLLQGIAKHLQPAHHGASEIPRQDSSNELTSSPLAVADSASCQALHLPRMRIVIIVDGLWVEQHKTPLSQCNWTIMIKMAAMADVARIRTSIIASDDLPARSPCRKPTKTYM
jgi:hypothetical protein